MLRDDNSSSSKSKKGKKKQGERRRDERRKEERGEKAHVPPLSGLGERERE